MKIIIRELYVGEFTINYPVQVEVIGEDKEGINTITEVYREVRRQLNETSIKNPNKNKSS